MTVEGSRAAHPATLDPALVDECRALMARHAKSFTRAARLLPKRYGDPVAVVYAFCRLADDAVDCAPDKDSARVAADRFAAAFEDDEAVPGRPVLRAFNAWSADRPLARRAARELLAGIASDVGPVRVADEAELVRYAYRVAGTVGLMMCVVLDVDDAAALPFAIDLGIGMQLTNIARDVAEDAARDRVYLPRTWLQRFGTSPEALLAQRAPAVAVAPAIALLLALADHYYASAEAGMRYLPPIVRPAILVASRLYRAIGTVIAERGYDPWRGRAVVPGAMRPWLTLHALARSAQLTFVRDGDMVAHDAALHVALAGLPGADHGATRDQGGMSS